MLCSQCSKDIEKEKFVERNGKKICLDCENNNKNFFKSLDTEKLKGILSKYLELENFDINNNKNRLIKHIRSMLDDLADLHKNADEKALLWIKEKRKELRKLLFTLKIEISGRINDELILFTLVNEKTNHSLFVAFPINKNALKYSAKLAKEISQILFVFMEGCTDEDRNFNTISFSKILEKISCLSPATFDYAFSSGLIKEEEKNRFLTEIKGISAESLEKLHSDRKKRYLSNCCQTCQEVFKTMNLEKTEELINKFMHECKEITCTNFWNKEFSERRTAHYDEPDRVIFFYLEQLFIKKEKGTESDFNLPVIPHHFLYQGRFSSFRFSRNKNSKLNEIISLLKVSINHNLSLLAKTFSDVIEHFYSNEMGKPSIDKEFQFKIELGDSPDISISPETGWNERTIEMTESSLLKLTAKKRKGKKIEEIKHDHKKFFDGFMLGKLKEWKDKGIVSTNDRLKSLKPLENFEEIEKITRGKWCYIISFKKIPTLDELIKNITEDIRKKNNETHYNFDALWIFCSFVTFYMHKR